MLILLLWWRGRGDRRGRGRGRTGGHPGPLADQLQSNRDNGAAFFLSLDDELGSLVLNNQLVAADHSSPYAYFGYALDCTDSQALVGAHGTDRVYCFSLNRD